MSKNSTSSEFNDISGKIVDINELQSRFSNEIFVKPYRGSVFKRKIAPLFASSKEALKVACLLHSLPSNSDGTYVYVNKNTADEFEKRLDRIRADVANASTVFKRFKRTELYDATSQAVDDLRNNAFADAGDMQSLARRFNVRPKTMRAYQTILAQCDDHSEEVKAGKIIRKPLGDFLTGQGF